MSVFQWVNRHPKLVPFFAALTAALYMVSRMLLLRTYDFLTWDSILVSVLVIVLCVCLQLYAMRRESLPCMQALENCDPEPLLNFSRDLLSSRSPKDRALRNVRFTGAFNEMTALISMGRLPEAVVVTQSIQEQLPKLAPIYRAYFSTNHAVLLLDQGRLEEAADALGNAKEFLSRQKKPSPVWQQSLSATTLLYRIGAEPISEALLTEARAHLAQVENDSLRTCVIAQVCVARCLLGLNRREEAFPHLRFIAQNGGKLWQRQWAETQMSAGFPTTTN